MMKRERPHIAVSFVSLLVLFLLPTSSALALTSSTELIEEHKAYDGQVITFEGEAIGDIMVRGDNAWIHLNDDQYGKMRSRKLSGYNSGMAVWLPANEAAKITTLGNYDNWGDLVRVVGTFNAACPEHGGDMDIHAISLAIIDPGEAIERPIETERIYWALGLGLSSALLFFLNRRKSRP